MKSAFAVLSILFILLANGCKENVTTIGNGKVDVIEAATIQVAVDLALTSHPEAVEPAYKVSSELLKVLSSEAVIPSMLGSVLDKELGKLQLDPQTLVILSSLIETIESGIKAEIGTSSNASKILVIRQVVQIVNNTAQAHIK